MSVRAKFFCPVDGDTPTPCGDDMFVNGMRKIFSPEYIDSLIGGTNNVTTKAIENTEFPIQIITHSLAVVTTIMLGLYLFWVLYARLVRTSQTGSAVEEKETLMTIVRPLYAFVAVFPTTYGFPLIVHALLLVAMLSNGTANWLMARFTSSPLQVSSSFLFEQTNVRAKGTYSPNGYEFKMGNAIRSTGVLRDLNQLKHSSFIGFQHGLCLKHWSENKMEAYAFFPRSPSSGSVPTGITSVRFYDVSQKGTLEKMAYWFLTNKPSDTGQASAEEMSKASGSANPICGRYSVDFITQPELANEIRKSEDLNNTSLQSVKKEIDELKDTIAIRGSAIINARGVHNLQAYLMGVDMALGSKVVSGGGSPLLKEARDGLYDRFYQIANKAINDRGLTTTATLAMSNNTSNLYAGRFNTGLGALENLNARHITPVLNQIKTKNFMMGYSGFVPTNLYDINKGVSLSAVNEGSSDPLEVLFGVIDGQIEPKLDKAHYEVMGNTRHNAQPNLIDQEQRITAIKEKVERAVLSKGWLNAGNSTAITRKLNQMLNTNLLSQIVKGDYYAMDMQTDYAKGEMDNIKSTAEEINNGIGKLSDRVQLYPQDYVGTATKAHAVKSNIGDGGEVVEDKGFGENYLSVGFVNQLEKSMINAMLGDPETKFNPDHNILESMRNTGELALVGAIGIDTIATTINAGASMTENIVVLGSSIGQPIANLFKVAWAVIGGSIEELSDFLHNMHTFMAITIPMLPNVILVLAGLGGFIQLVVTSIAVVLYMIMHAKPEQTFVGSNIQLYLLFLNVFLRPILIYSAFLMTTVLLTVIIPIAIEVWFATKPDTVAEVGASPYFSLMWTLASMKKSWYVLAGMITGVTYITASLIQEIPEMVANIMNTNVYPVMGALNSERFISQMVSSASSQSGYRKKAVDGIRQNNLARAKQNQDEFDRQRTELKDEVKNSADDLANKQRRVDDLESERNSENRAGRLGGGGMSVGQQLALGEKIAKAKTELASSQEAYDTNKARLSRYEHNARAYSGRFGVIRPSQRMSLDRDFGYTRLQRGEQVLNKYLGDRKQQVADAVGGLIKRKKT